jgi:peptide/nickel transport system ATP-binding protein
VSFQEEQMAVHAAGHAGQASSIASPAAGDALLTVRNLSISLDRPGGAANIVRNVSFQINAGEIVGLVGESGCGKTMTSLTLMGLQARNRSILVDGEVRLEGRDIIRMSRRELRRLTGDRISMVFQEPMTALDPVFTIGEQISEVVRTHRSVSRHVARQQTLDALAQVEIPDPVRRYDAYPHQLSGGMRQRAMIAMAIVCEPRLLIADEPTTALDVTIQAQIIDLLKGLCDRIGMAMLLVTHDLGLVAQNCERVLTMYAGELVEEGPTQKVLFRPGHPYTSGLMRAIPALMPRKAELATIPGRVPRLSELPPGCRFEPRCSYAIPACGQPQEMRSADEGGQSVRCCRYPELELQGVWS